MLTMYDQTTFSDKTLGTHGDCVRACYQTILQDSLAGFPHPISLDGEMNPAFFAALEERGWKERFAIFRKGRDFSPLPRIVLAAGPTVRTAHTGVHHGVVYDRLADRMIHDPHPSRAGLLQITFFYWLERVH